jgi:hypothetical protein
MRKPIALRTIDHVPEGYRLIRPAMPVTVPSTTEYYICGRCSTLLAVAEQGQLHHLSLNAGNALRSTSLPERDRRGRLRAAVWRRGLCSNENTLAVDRGRNAT